MALAPPRRGEPANRLLANLPRADYERLLPHLQPVRLTLKQVLCEAGSPLEYAYFLDLGVISVLLLMEAGSAIEVATIGNEGMMGLPLLMGIETVPYRYFMQSDGHGVRIKAAALRREIVADGPLRRLLQRYNSVFVTSIMRSAGCNGLHTVPQRCCRWILNCQDRLRADKLPMTHEFLALMLGVRRASVTEVLHPLQTAGLIRCGRGTIVILDRPGLETGACECYQAAIDEYERVLGAS